LLWIGFILISMIDIRNLRENSQRYKTACLQKGCKVDIDQILNLDRETLKAKQELQDIATQKNRAGKAIAKIEDANERKQAVQEMGKLKGREKTLTEAIAKLEPELHELLLLVAMPPHPDSPIGRDESDNVEVKRHGEIRQFDFEPKDHILLGMELGIIDVERGVKLSGTRNYVLRGDGAMLHRAVLSLSHDMMVAKGFEPLTIPVLTKEVTFMGTGWFPEGKPQVYQVPEDELFLVGTAEVPVTSLHMGEILDEDELPKRFVAQSLCFRREAGAAGKDTYGLYRIHQFEKVEQVIVCKYDLEEAEKWHQHILQNSEELLQALELPYRVLEICTGDMGTGKYRMYDIETYMPSRQAYCETHSASNFLDFQARRLNLRYRDRDRKVHHCITMNNTVVASPRILIPLIELNQNADGSINIPKTLQPYMQNRKRIV